jgi:hypothetical protein
VVPALAAAFFVARAYAMRGAWVDDSYIVLRYAWNLTHGQGLSWSTALPPAEGYSDLLWVLWCALGMALGLPGVSWAIVSGIAFGGLSVFMTAMVVREVGARRGAPALASLLASTVPCSVWWATGGLEGPLYGFLIISGLFFLARQHRAWSAGRRPLPIAEVLFALVAITHVSGPLLLACPVLLRLRHWRRLPFGRSDAVALLVLLLPLVLQFGVRLLWLGDPLPTTYYAKFGIQCWADLMRYLDLAFAWNPALTAVWFLGALMSLRRGWAWLTWPGLLGLTYVILVRGDGYMGQSRLLVPFIPAACAAAAAGFDALPSYRRSAQTWILRPLALCLLGLAFTRSLGVGEVAHEEGGQGTLTTVPFSWSALTKQKRARRVPWLLDLIVQQLGEGEAVFISDIGQVAFMVPDNPVLDGRGLNWRAMAHLRRRTVLEEHSLDLDDAHEVLEEFAAASPALVFLVCHGDRIQGFAETYLQTLPVLTEGYRFLGRGPYFGSGKMDTCAYQRDDARPPTAEVVRARYARLLSEDPLYLWEQSREAWERGERLEVSGQAPRLSPPDRLVPTALRAP